MQEKIYKRPLIFGILIAIIIHSVAILTRELSPVPLFPTVIDALAFNGTWIYIVSIGITMAFNVRRVKDLFTCIPERIGSRTIEGQKLVLAYEFLALGILLFIVPALTYFYGQVETYFSKQYPDLHRFIEYMPFTDLLNKAISSYSFFITLFALVSLLCVIMPHTYLVYKCSKKAAAPLQSAIGFSILLSAGITASVAALLALTIESWILIVLVITSPVVLLSFIVVNIVMLRYHDKFIICADNPER